MKATSLLLCVSAGAVVAQRIKKVIVLMQENRSYDSRLGWFHDLQHLDGLNGTEFNYYNVTNPELGGVYVSDDAEYIAPCSPGGNGYGATTEQVYGSQHDIDVTDPGMRGFLQRSTRRFGKECNEPMRGFNADTTPVMHALARDFGVMNRFFTSIPAPTQPNRMYQHAGTSWGEINNNPPRMVLGYPQRTFYEDLEDAGHSWGIYFQAISSALELRNLRREGRLRNFHLYRKFLKDLDAGTLPDYTFIEPNYFSFETRPANDEHEPHPVNEGDRLFKEMYEAIRVSPQWNETLFIITYDEHGGYYDHINPPFEDIPNPDGLHDDINDFHFDRLGVRIPVIMISPWVDKGASMFEPTGDGEVFFDHTSILKTVRHHWGMESPYITDREVKAGDFSEMFMTRDTPRTDCPMTLPDVPELSPEEMVRLAHEPLVPGDLQEELLESAFTLTTDKVHDLKYMKTAADFPHEHAAGTWVMEAVNQFFLDNGIDLEADADA